MINKDTVGGSVILLLGLFVLTFASTTLSIGTLTDMGPGFLPVCLGTLLVFFGVPIIASGVRYRPPAIALPPLRSTLLISAAPIAFALLVRPVGLIGAVFASAELALLASPSIGFRQGLIIAAALTAASLALFSYGLGVATPLLGSWTRW